MEDVIELSEGKVSYMKQPKGRKAQICHALNTATQGRSLTTTFRKTIAILQKQIPEKYLERKSRIYQKLKYSHIKFKNWRKKLQKQLEPDKPLQL